MYNIAMDLETTGERRMPTNLGLLMLIYVMITTQIWGLFIENYVKPFVIPTNTLEQTSSEIAEDYILGETINGNVTQNVIVSAGIIRFIDNIPMTVPGAKTLAEAISDYDSVRAEEFEETTIAIDTPEKELLYWEEGLPAVKTNHSEAEIQLLAILLEGEGGGLESLTELSGIGWTVVNRIKSEKFPNDVISVITQEGQFDGYTAGGTYSERSYWLACDILARADLEASGMEGVGRTLPEEYLYFHGDGKHNYFKITEHGSYYNWTNLESPYTT